MSSPATSRQPVLIWQVTGGLNMSIALGPVGRAVEGFDVYSGYLTVPGPFELTEYDSLSIHYQFHTSQRSPSKDPLVTWHQGGPGASSVSLGLYTEMGYFQLDDAGTHVNPYAWNKVANMLYLESPAGSGTAFLAGKGSSECLKKGRKVFPAGTQILFVAWC